MSFSTSRLAAGLSLDDVSREFHIPPATVEDWECGHSRPPANVTKALDVMASYETTASLGRTEQKPTRTQRWNEPTSSGTSGENLIKSRQRVADHGEVFTPPWLVNKMLDLVQGESERIDSRFLEPACGSGNFLVAVLRRKLQTVEAKYGQSAFNKKLYALQALACCYGIELLADNIAECRKNMLDIFAAFLGIDERADFYRAASHVLSLNLVHGDAMSMKTVATDECQAGPIMIVEWAYTGRAGKFNRRDFRLEVLTQASGFNQRWATPDTEQEVSLFREPRPAFHHRGRDPIFVPLASYPPMTVRDLAALDAEPTA